MKKFDMQFADDMPKGVRVLWWSCIIGVGVCMVLFAVAAYQIFKDGLS